MELALVSQFYKFIEEREAIRLRRLAGQPWPWTQNSILQQYRFTNVKREHDRTTSVFIDEFYRPNAARPFSEIMFNAAVFRYFGTILFARAVGWSTLSEKSLAGIKARAAELVAEGKQIFTGAYVLSNAGIRGPKHEVVCDHFLRGLVRHNIFEVITAIQRYWSLEAGVTMLCYAKGFSSFMAKEVLLDTQYTQAWPEAGATDKNTWTAMGPGGIRGATRVRYGVLPAKPVKAPEALEICRTVFAARGEFWPAGFVELELADIQFQFCEFDKYQRTLLGEGRPRSRYKKES